MSGPGETIPVARSVELGGQSVRASVFTPAFDFDPALVGSAYGSTVAKDRKQHVQRNPASGA